MQLCYLVGGKEFVLACISARCHSRRMCTCAGRMSRRSNTASAGSSPIPPQRLALPGLTAASVGRHPTFRQIQTSGTIRTSAGSGAVVVFKPSEATTESEASAILRQRPIGGTHAVAQVSLNIAWRFQPLLLFPIS